MHCLLSTKNGLRREIDLASFEPELSKLKDPKLLYNLYGIEWVGVYMGWRKF